MADIMDGMSMNLEQANMDKLKAVFPECFAEGKLDIDKLLSLCGEYIDNDFEKYKLNSKTKIFEFNEVDLSKHLTHEQVQTIQQNLGYNPMISYNELEK